MIQANYEEITAETGYFTHEDRGSAAKHSATKYFGMNVGKRYRLTIDDFHLCFNSSTGAITNDGIGISIRSNPETTTVKWKDVESNLYLPDGEAQFKSSFTHGAGAANSCWPRTQSWNSKNEDHECNPSEHSAYIGDEVPDIGNAKLIFETDQAVDVYQLIIVDVYGTVNKISNQYINYNARYRFETIT